MLRVFEKTTHPARREAGLKVAAVLPGRSKANAVLRLTFGLSFCRQFGIEGATRLLVLLGEGNDTGLCVLVPYYPGEVAHPHSRALIAMSNTTTRVLSFAAGWLPKAFHHSPEKIENVRDGKCAEVGGRYAIFFALPAWALTERKR